MIAKWPFGRPSAPGESGFDLAQDVALVPAPDGSGRLLDMNGNFYALPTDSFSLLQSLLQSGRGGTVASLAERLGGDVAAAEAEVGAFLEELQAERVICRHGQRPRRRLRAALAYLLAPLVWLGARAPGWRLKAWLLLPLAWLSVRLAGWTATRRAWTLWSSRTQRPSSPGTEQVVSAIDMAVRSAASWHVVGVECKERALTAFALLRVARRPASLVVGVQFFPLGGHCWCSSGARTVGDVSEHCATFTPVLQHE
jgi:hypothetical protein